MSGKGDVVAVVGDDDVCTVVGGSGWALSAIGCKAHPVARKVRLVAPSSARICLLIRFVIVAPPILSVVEYYRCGLERAASGFSMASVG